MKTTFKKLNLVVSISGLILASLVFSSCDKGSSNTVNNPACGPGYNYYNNMCYPVNGQGNPTQPGFNYGNGFYADNYSNTSTLRVVNGAAMKQFFKMGMGVCDRAASNYGLASCDSYVGGYMDVIIRFPNAQNSSLLATFIARPRYNPNGWYSAQLPSGYGLLGAALGMATGIYMPDPKAYYGAYRNPLQLEMAVSAINNSAGFEARGYGDYWTGMFRTLLAIQVPQGKMEDNNFNFNFIVSGQTAAQGTMTKCRTMNCGL